MTSHVYAAPVSEANQRAAEECRSPAPPTLVTEVKMALRRSIVPRSDAPAPPRNASVPGRQGQWRSGTERELAGLSEGEGPGSRPSLAGHEVGPGGRLARPDS